MVTATTYDNCYEFRGLSSDKKPVKTAGGKPVGNGSIFLEMDTSKVFIFDEKNQEWLELGVDD